MDSAAAIGLHAVIFIAALFQTATGIGFALIAGPFLLIFLQDGSAVQISILLNLFLSVILAPALLRHVHWSSLRSLTMGLVLGLPLGTAMFLAVDLTVIKLGAALFVFLAWLFFLRPPTNRPGYSGKTVGIGMGLIAGTMSGFAAMPGPAASLYLSGLQDLPRDTARSTIYAFFVIAYGAALALHSAFTGVSEATLVTSLWFAPATIAGMFAGMPLARRLSQQQFRVAVAITLLATALALIITTFIR